MRTQWIVAGALMALATVAQAQGRGQGRGRDRDRGADNSDRGLPPGQAKKAERREQRDQDARFADRDRDIARNWYVHERRDARDDDNRDDRGDDARGLPPGLRDRDRLPPGIERKLAAGYLLSADDRRVLYPAPVILVRAFPPPPPGFRYFAFGGHIVMVDGGWRVRDVIHLEITAGR